MAVVRVIFAFALLVCWVEGGTVRWIGGNMSFSNPDNWEGGLTPDSARLACNTTFGVPGKNIIAKLENAVYYVGRTLFLPRNGALRLSLLGTSIAFTSFPADSSCPANSTSYKWTGGAQPERRNDFACHRNWQDVDDTTLNYVPCASDIARFDSSSTYGVFVPNNVTLVVISQLIFGSIAISSPTTSLAPLLPQINLVDTTATVFIGTASASGQTPYNAVCKPLMQFAPGTSSCICYSSCPSQTQSAQQQANTQTNTQVATNALIVLQNTNITRNFRGVFAAGALSATVEQLQSNFENATQVSLLQSLVQAAVMAQLPAWSFSVSLFALSADNVSVTIQGTVTAVNSSLFAGGSTANPPNPITWNLASALPPANATSLQTIIQSTTAPALLAYYQVQLQAFIAAAQQALNPSASALVNTINNITQTIPSSTVSAATNAAATDPCLVACITACSDCLANITAAIIAAGVGNQSIADALAQAILEARQAAANANTSWTSTVNLVATVANATAASQAVANQQQAATPQVFTVDSLPFYIGRTGSVADQLRAVEPASLPRFLSTLRDTILGIHSLPIRSVSNLRATWTRSIGSRRAVPTTASAVVVTFTYTVSCLPLDAPCQSNSTTSVTYTTVNSGMNNAFASFAGDLNLCQYTGAQSVTYNSIYNMSCLNVYAATYCSGLVQQGLTEASARTMTMGYLLNTTRCGSQPAAPDGSCFDPSYTAQAQYNATGISAAVACDTGNGGGGFSGSTGGGGGGGMAMGAGAAGAGVLIIIVIVVIVMRRKKSQGSGKGKKASDDRTVVAFENPMYDDPTGNMNQPTYDNNMIGGAHESEGLYDEPAFNAANKMNPVYQSTEDLVEGGGAGVQGGDGYLDVSPKVDQPEDVGYLGGQAEDVGAPEYACNEDDFAAAE